MKKVVFLIAMLSCPISTVAQNGNSQGTIRYLDSLLELKKRNYDSSKHGGKTWEELMLGEDNGNPSNANSMDQENNTISAASDNSSIELLRKIEANSKKNPNPQYDSRTYDDITRQALDEVRKKNGGDGRGPIYRSVKPDDKTGSLDSNNSPINSININLIMWTLIVAVIIFVIGKFLYDKSQQSNKISKEGGMAHKYRTLIPLLMGSHPNSKIFQVTGDSLLLGVSSNGGTTTYNLLQTFGKVTITWKVDSPVYGKHTLEWGFDEFMDQNKMVEKIMNDLKQYQINVMTA